MFKDHKIEKEYLNNSNGLILRCKNEMKSVIRVINIVFSLKANTNTLFYLNEKQ